MMSKRHIAQGAVVALVALVALTACVPPPAPPPDPLVSCESLLVQSAYSPPATTADDDVTGTIESGSGVSGCTDFTGRGVTGTTLIGTFQVVGACSYHPPGETWGWGTGQLTWSDGSVSDWAGQLVAETPLRVDIQLTGGLWTGATASLPMNVNGGSGSCGAGGITDVVIEGGLFVLRPAGSTGRPPLSGVEQISAGGSHTCALVDGSTVKCWGANDIGQLGVGVSGVDPSFDELLPVAVVGLGAASEVTAGERHTCALVAGGEARCWGQNYDGQLGDGSTTSSDLPVDVVGLSGATAISAGNKKTCAVVAGGAVSCWGAGSPVPAPVPGLSGATTVSVGGSPFAANPGAHACALVTAGGVVCWGNNSYGQLGDGTDLSSSTPVTVAGVTGATALVAGPYASTCAVVGGGVECWGNNSYGQLGNGTNLPANPPVPVAGLSVASSIAVGHCHSCAVRTGGSASCWGGNGKGQLGTGNRLGGPTPAEVIAGY